ncbi:MAG: hypothetical protein KDD64_08255 [Bdellovibrionales bacterium]|nr:hypothetical protein [Bdellovibrionales bacterium]
MNKKRFLRFSFAYFQIVVNYGLTILLNNQLAHLLGLTREKDVFDIAYSLPFLILELAGLNFVHSVVTSLVRRAAMSSREEATKTISQLLFFYSCAGAALTLVAFFLLPIVVPFLAPGFNAPELSQAESLAQISLLCLFFMGVNTVVAASSTALGLPAGRELALSIMKGSAFGYIWLSPDPSLRLVLGSFVLGLLLCSTLQVLVLCRFYGFSFRASNFSFRAVNFSAVRGSFYFFIAAISSTLLTIYINRTASQIGEGSIALLGYSLALCLPIAVLTGKPLALVLAPKLIIHQVSHAKKTLFRTVSLWTGITGLAAFGIAALVSLLAPLIVSWLYGGGNFTPAAEEAVVATVRKHLWLVPPASLLWIYLYPLQNFRDGLYGAASYILGNLCGFLFIYSFRESSGLDALIFGQILTLGCQASFAITFLFLLTSLQSDPREEQHLNTTVESPL